MIQNNILNHLKGSSDIWCGFMDSINEIVSSISFFEKGFFLIVPVS